MERTQTFKLPPDIIVSVLQCLDPVDIVAMRATCRTFYKASSSRSVWLSALDRVCNLHGIFKPTYPAEKMTRTELEHAASSPHRFIKFVNEFDSLAKSTQSYLKREFPCRKKNSGPGIPGGAFRVTHLSLVPGGRFLITAAGSISTAAGGNLCLWDLGYSMDCPLKSFPMATLPITGQQLILSTFPARNGAEFLSAVVTFGPSPHCALAVYRVDPMTPKPEFVLQNELDLTAHRKPFSKHIYLHEPMIVLKSGTSVIVWNWAEGTGCRWICSDLEASISMLVCDNTVISIDDDQDFTIWDIPAELPPLGPADALQVITDSPKRVRRRRWDGPPSFEITSTPAWQQHTQPHLCFVVDEEDDADFEKRLFLYSVRRVGRQDAAFLPTYLPVDGGEAEYVSGDIAGAITGPVSPLFLCDNRLVMCSLSSEDELVATVLPVPTETCDEIVPRSALLLKDVNDNAVLDSDTVAFCPMSGRVVYPVYISDTSLQVLDFLLPLEG